jgi:hypothetical protein
MKTEICSPPLPRCSQPRSSRRRRRPGNASSSSSPEQINNDHTHRDRLNATRRFSEWCGARGIGQLADVQACHVAAFIKDRQGQFLLPTVKQQGDAMTFRLD